MTTTPFIPLFRVKTASGIGAAVQECFDRGVVTEGPKAAEFERRLAMTLGVESERAVLTNSCTSALHLAYDLCGVRPGTNVVASPMTCLAGLLPILHLGGKIHWADIDPMTGNLTVEAARHARDHNTKAVYGVLWGGEPVDPGLANLGVPFIQDAAHGFLAYTPQGSVSCLQNTWTCYSMQAIKHLTTSDGGLLVAPDANMAACARKLRWFGLDRTIQGKSRWCQDIEMAGYKFHMNDVSAAIGLEQLPGAVDSVRASRDNAWTLNQLLGKVGLKHVKRVWRDVYGVSSSWLYTILTPRRDQLQEHLAAHGIASDVVHVRCDRYGLFDDPAYATQRVRLPGVDKFDAWHLCIPCGWWVSRNDIQDRIVPAILEFDRSLPDDEPKVLG